MNKRVELRNGLILEISRPTGENAAEMLEYLKIIGGETHFLLFDGQGLPYTAEQEARILDGFAAQKRGGFFFGRINGEIACTFNLSCRDRARIAHVGEVALAVRKKYWRIGVGSAIMETIIELGKKAGLGKLELGCYADNARAHALYERYGFVDVGRRKNQFYIDGIYYDEILMELYLGKEWS